MIPASLAADASASEAGSVCDVCGTPDRLGIATCASCVEPDSDAYLFLDSSTRRANRRALESWLVDTLDGAITRSEARDAAEGTRPVVGLPAAAAGEAAKLLALRGVGAATIPRSAAWRRVPPGLLAIAATALGLGLFLGLTGTPSMLLLAPIFSGLLVVAAVNHLRSPIWRPEARSGLGLPDGVEPRVRTVLARLGDGRARRRLRDLATLSTALLEGDELPADEDLRRAASELLYLVCDAVTDLDQLDRSLEILEQEPNEDGPDETIVASVGEATLARDRLVARLDEAVATLVRAQAATSESAAELLDIAERLAEEATHRSEAWREVQRLTG